MVDIGGNVIFKGILGSLMKSKIIVLKDLFVTNQLLSGSLIMVIGSNFYNFGQFVYHFITGRFLGKAYYGDLAAIISLLGIVTVVQLAFNLTIVRYIASTHNESLVKNFIKWIYRWSLILGIMVALLTLILSPWLASFLNLTQPQIAYLLSPLLLFFVVTTTGRSVLQGLLKFKHYVISLITESVVKIILALVFILLGYAIWGAMAALLLSIILGFLVVRVVLNYYLKGPLGEKPEIAPLLKYSFFVLIQGLALTSMYSSDLLLVKHFFSAEEAGIYASLAILGRVTFFGASPITHVMFPLIAKRHSLGQGYNKIFYSSLLLLIGFSACILLFYYFFPGIAISILFGAAFLEGAPLLWWFALFMMLLSVAMLVTQYYLSIGKTKIVTLFALAALLQVVLIWFTHPSLLTVIKLSVLSAALLDLALFVYFPYHRK